MFSFFGSNGESASSSSGSGASSSSSGGSAAAAAGADASIVASLKKEVEDLRKLLTKTEAKAAAAEALNNDGSDVGVLKGKVVELEAKLALAAKELADAVQKYRLLIIDASKAAHVEVTTNDAIKATIEKQKDDFIFRDQTNAMAQLKSEIEALKKQLSDKDKTIDEQKELFQQKHAEWVAQTENLVAAMGEHKVAHSNVLNTVADELQQQQKKNQEVANTVGDTEVKTQQAAQVAAKATEKLEASEKAVAEAQLQLAALSSELADLQASSSKTESTNQALNRQITESRNSQIILEGQIEALNEKLAKAARDGDAQVAAMERKVDGLKEKLLDAEGELKKSNDDLARALADVAKAKAEKDAVARNLADQRDLNEKALGAKDAANTTAATAAKQIADLAADAANKDEAYRTERKALLSRIDELQRAATETSAIPVQWQRKLDDTVAAKAKELNALMAAHASENDANMQQLKQLKAVNDSLTAQNDDLGKKLATTSRGWDQDKGRISALEADLKTLKDKYADLPAQLSAAKMDAAAAQRMYEGQAALADQLRTQVLQVQGQLGTAQAQLSAAQTSTTATTQAVMGELQEVQTHNNFLRDKVADLQTQIAGLEADIGNLERQKMELGAANAALKADNKDLEKNLEATTNTLKEKETQLTTETITKTQRLPEGLQDKIDILTTQLRQVQSLTVSIQQDMVPVEETSYSKNTTSSSSSSSSSGK